MGDIIFPNELLGNVREFYAHILRSIHWCLEVKGFCIKADKARIATRQDTLNHDIDKAEGTCGRAYIAVITDTAARDGDACTIGIFLLRSDFTYNHGAANLFSSILRDIFKSNDAESVYALHVLVLGVP